MQVIDETRLEEAERDQPLISAKKCIKLTFKALKKAKKGVVADYLKNESRQI